MGVITIYKNIGETPLEALERLRCERSELADAVLSYIGRLDPMAEGVMLVLVGEENKNRDAYLLLDKEYEFEVLFGFATDTHDVLGLVTGTGGTQIISKETVEKKLKSLVGKRVQTYPAYSSKPVDGKPLHEWAREGRLNEIEIPKKEIEIYSIQLVEFYTIEKDAFAALIADRIALVKGDFRQSEILDRWRETFAVIPSGDFPVAKIKISCSSGTYVRVIAKELGEMLGVPAVATGIKRVVMTSN